MGSHGPPTPRRRIADENFCGECIDLARAVGSATGHQYPAGVQGLPLLQGWIAKAPTCGSRRQIVFLNIARGGAGIADRGICISR